MNINYKIMWFEDLDEWYTTLSRRIERYIKSKNFKVEFKRVKGIEELDLNNLNLKEYDLLIVDYELEKKNVDGILIPTYGYEIIEMVRKNLLYNDVLFYSSHGYNVLNDLLKSKSLQGVFIAERDNDEFINVAKALIDKSIRRSESLINIRGIMMDNTSEFDNKIRDIINRIWNLLNCSESIVDKIQKKILKSEVDSATKIQKKYSIIDDKNIYDLLNERSFSAHKQARLLNWCVNDEFIKKNVYDIFNKYSLINDSNNTIDFFQNYDNDIIKYRNALAHIKRSPTNSGEFYIGNINGNDVKFDEELCDEIRMNLLKYDSILEELYQVLENL